MRIIAKWVLISLALLALPKIIPGIAIASFTTALIVAFFLGFANVLIKPLLLIILFPITIVTLGLFAFVVNALLFWGIASFVDGFTVDGFLPAFLGALVMSAVGVVVNILLSENKED